MVRRRSGVDAFVGIHLLGSSQMVALTAEERVGRIQGRERMRSTRLGLTFAL